MRLLYFTREWTGHDRRFVAAFCSHGIELGVLTLFRLPAVLAARECPGTARFLGSLGLDMPADRHRLADLVSGYRSLEEAFAPDLVLAGPLTDCAFVKALTASTVPWVAQSWAFDVFWEWPQGADIASRVEFTLRQCPPLFADSQAVVAQCELIAGRSLPHRYLMPWGIDLAEIQQPRDRKALRQELGVMGCEVFLHTRGLEPVYGVETLLGAFRLVHEDDPTTLLLLASTGSLRSEVESFVARHALPKAIRLLGRVPHSRVLDLFAASDCYVSCAASDGTSVSLLEAMALGVPPIVPDTGGNTEWIRNEDHGWVVPVGDAARLRTAMVAAANLEPGIRDRMAARNREAVRARANWASNFPGFLGFLRGCTQDGGTASVIGSQLTGCVAIGNGGSKPVGLRPQPPNN